MGNNQPENRLKKKTGRKTMIPTLPAAGLFELNQKVVFLKCITDMPVSIAH